MRSPKAGALPAASLSALYEGSYSWTDVTRLPKWAIQGTGKLCGIAHEGALVSEASLNELLLDSLDTSVHHVARCNAVCTGECVAERYLSEALDGGTSVDGAILVKKTAVAMGSVLAQTNVACDVERREEGFEPFNGKNNWSRRVVGGSTSTVLIEQLVVACIDGQTDLFTLEWNTKDHDTCEALLDEWTDEFV